MGNYNYIITETTTITSREAPSARSFPDGKFSSEQEVAPIITGPLSLIKQDLKTGSVSLLREDLEGERTPGARIGTTWTPNPRNRFQTQIEEILAELEPIEEVLATNPPTGQAYGELTAMKEQLEREAKRLLRDMDMAKQAEQRKLDPDIVEHQTKVKFRKINPSYLGPITSIESAKIFVRQFDDNGKSWKILRGEIKINGKVYYGEFSRRTIDWAWIEWNKDEFINKIADLDKQLQLLNKAPSGPAYSGLFDTKERRGPNKENLFAIKDCILIWLRADAILEIHNGSQPVHRIQLHENPSESEKAPTWIS